MDELTRDQMNSILRETTYEFAERILQNAKAPLSIKEIWLMRGEGSLAAIRAAVRTLYDMDCIVPTEPNLRAPTQKWRWRLREIDT